MRSALVLLRVFCAYLALAATAVMFTRFQGGVALLWFATSYLIAELSLFRRRQWPGMLAAAGLASLLVTGLIGLGWRAALPLAAVNLLEALTATVLLRRKAREVPFTSLRWFGWFTLATGVIAPLAGAVLLSLVAGGIGLDPRRTFINFYTGHALSNLTFAPLFLLIARGELASCWGRARRRPVETALLMTFSIGTTVFTFAQSSAPLLFLPIMPIMLVTFRLGRGAAAMSILLLALIGGGFTLEGMGPLQLFAADAGARAQLFQFYLAATVLTIWPVAADLRNRARLHGQLRQSELRYRMIAENSSDILMQNDRDGNVTYVSPAILEIGGYEPTELIGRSAASLIAEEDRDRVAIHHHRAMTEPDEGHAFEYRGLTKSGESRWFETRARALFGEGGKVVGTISIIRDVSARKAREQSLATQALTDPLTNLPNRRAFKELVSTRPNRGVSDCLALLDIDHFKRVNDQWGHEAGDTVLRQFAEVAGHALRKQDVMARIGGEEFALLLRDTELDLAVEICERVRAAVAKAAVAFEGDHIAVTVSGGVAAIGTSGFEAAMRRADGALYRAKQSGRDQLLAAA